MRPRVRWRRPHQRGRISTTAGAFELEFAHVLRKTIAIEAGMHSPWISRLLSRLGHEVIVANPQKLRLIYENLQKNDRVDAEYLARVARLDRKLLGRVEQRGETSQAAGDPSRARHARAHPGAAHPTTCAPPFGPPAAKARRPDIIRLTSLV